MQKTTVDNIIAVPTPIVATMVIIVVGLGFLALKEMQTWGVTKREPRHALALAQRANYRAALAYGGEADALAKAGDIAGALRQYEAALRSDPAVPGIHNNLGTLYSRLG